MEKFFTENLQRALIRKLDKKIFISIIRDIANENRMEVQKIVWKKFENRWKFCNNQGLDTFGKGKSPTRRTDGGLG
mgnify:CR=1 FL=1